MLVSSIPTSYSTSRTSPSNDCVLVFWGMGLHVTGPIMPKSFNGHSQILAATDYFSKRVEAIPLRESKTKMRSTL